MLYRDRILVAVEGSANCRIALNRASLIAVNTGKLVELIWFGSKPAWQSLKDEIAELESRCEVLKSVCSGDLLKDVKQNWARERFGLFVKGCDTRHDNTTLSVPTDWKLLRETPSPVLLVKGNTQWEGGVVLAAINPMSKEASGQLHDLNVLKLSESIVRETNARLHAVVATPPPMLSAEPEAQVPKLILERARNETIQELKECGVEVDQLHIGEGPVEYWIAQVAQEQNASLVVISTRARGGMKGVLLGNTAEYVLDQLHTDVLVLRPE